MNNNENITDITEVVEHYFHGGFSRMDVSEYKWKLVGDNQNEPTQVHFYNEDMNDKLSVSLSTLFDRCLKEYKHHLEEEEEKEKRELEEEIRVKKEELLNDQLNEILENYELFIKQQVKDELRKQNLKVNLTNIRKTLDENFVSFNKNGVHLGIGNRKQNSIWIQEEWYLENYDKLKLIILSLCPDYKPSSSPVSENKHGFKFMELQNENRKGSYSHNHDDFYHHYADTETMEGFYDKLILLHRKMKNSKIGYWVP